jgi:hypothetical protein
MALSVTYWHFPSATKSAKVPTRQIPPLAERARFSVATVPTSAPEPRPMQPSRPFNIGSITHDPKGLRACGSKAPPFQWTLMVKNHPQD